MKTLIIEVPGGSEHEGRRAAERIYGIETFKSLQWIFNNEGQWVAETHPDDPPIKVYERGED